MSARFLPKCLIAYIIFVGWNVSIAQEPIIVPQIRELFRIGEANPDENISSQEIFGNIRSMATDVQDNLYVLDERLFLFRKYDKDGKFIQQIDLQRGQGSGEFVAPRHLAIDTSGNLYIACQSNRTLTMLSQHGDYLKNISLSFMPSGLAVSPDAIYITRFWLSGSGNIVHRYNLEMVFEGTFLEPPPHATLVARTGLFERVSISPSAHLIYSYPTPYRIIEFDREGKILKTARGQKQFTQLPTKEKIGTESVLILHQSSRGLTASPNGHVLNIVQMDDKYYLDVFDPDLTFISRIEATAFGMERLRYITVDARGDVYLDALEPLPHIRKYRILLSDSQ